MGLHLHLAEQAVDVETHRAGELINIIFKEAPPLAVWRLAVVAEGTSILCEGDAQVQKPLVILRRQQLPTHHSLGLQGSEHLICLSPNMLLEAPNL